MQRRKRSFLSFALIGVLALMPAGVAHAQALWKYTDKDGKVTYSDKAPKKGENAQLVTNDPAANVIDSPKSARDGVQKSPDLKARAAERQNLRDQLREALETAKDELEAAKVALEEGRDPQPDEVQIVVGRTPTGAPTGANAAIRKPEYYARIKALEEAVKKAQERLEIAEKDFRRGAP